MDGPAGIRVAVHIDGHAGAAWVAHRGPWGGLGGPSRPLGGLFQNRGPAVGGVVGPVMLKSQNQIMAKGYRRAARDEPFLLPPDMRE